MSKYIVDKAFLDNGLKRIADTVRAKTGNNGIINFPDGFIEQINNINTSFNDNPNQDRGYDPRLIATFNNVQDVDDFCNKYNHDNNYHDINTNNKLFPGTRIQINDGTYNSIWMIAGFDLEYKQKAADDTIYDNGYGLCLVPIARLHEKHKWNYSRSTSGGYLNSEMHKWLNSTVYNNLKKVLGDHLVNRNVLLSNSTDGNGYASSYQWTKAYVTSMSGCQLTGEQNKYRNKYDDGEATYKLPVLNYTNFNEYDGFWTRGIYNEYCVYTWGHDMGTEQPDNSRNYVGVRPLIYIR